MRILLTGIILFAAVAAPAAGHSYADAAAEVALVNGFGIPEAEYSAEFNRTLRRLGLAGEKLDSAVRVKLSRTVLEELVDREVLYQESRRKGVRVGVDEVEAEIDRLKDRFSSSDEFRDVLGKSSLSEEAVRRQVQKGMAIKALVEAEVGARVVLTENEVKEYYDAHPAEFRRKKEIRLSHILVKPKVHGVRKVREKALSDLRALQERIVRGEDFTDVAALSVEADINVVAGDMGYFQPGELPQKIENVAFALKPGEMSDIVEDRFGFHLLKVTDIRPEAVVPYEIAQYRIREKLRQGRVTRLLPDYVKKLRDNSEIIVLMRIKES